ncbi:hypothetical protein F2P56_004116 [Juglans regia]|uniref:RING-type E3 ubiquitin transferase n=2 Tax=Juglans regia TaxID=51240 RepID=A0A833Y3Y1_JUGRE|nr:RING-H2 finger protein ATL20-like [Juglans regia]KAF5477479.1 hypothetical protein F2P56_004116 [Juglans regia]
MDAFIFLVLFSSTLLLSAKASETNCPMMRCAPGAPKIQFPFHAEGLQPHSVHPSFKLACKDNATLIHLPSYGDLVIKSISYDAKRLDLLDPKNCVHEVFLNLDLSLTPFRYYYVVKNYTYLNCSSRLPPSFTEVPCLSGSGHHVYTVEPSLSLPDSCRPVKTVAIPFLYSPYLSDNSFGLGLSWDLPGFQDCEAEGGHCELKYKIRLSSVTKDKVFLSTMISICILGMAMLSVAFLKKYHSKKIHCQQETEEALYPTEIEKSYGDYDGLKPDSDDHHTDKLVNNIKHETV